MIDLYTFPPPSTSTIFIIGAPQGAKHSQVLGSRTALNLGSVTQSYCTCVHCIENSKITMVLNYIQEKSCAALSSL